MKLLKKLAFIVFIVVIAVYFGFNMIVQGVVEKAGTKALGVPVSVGFISLKPLAGKLHISNLMVANPEGFKADSFARVGDIDVALDMKTLTGDGPVMIDYVYITSPDLAYEFGKRSNVQALKDGMMKGKGTAQEKEKSSDAPRKVVIKQLKIMDATATPYFEEAGNVLGTVALADIELMDIGTKDKPVTLAQAFQFVFETLTKNLNRSVGTNPDVLMNKLKGGVKEGADNLKKNLDGAAKGLQGLIGTQQ